MKYPRLLLPVAVGARPVATVAVIEYNRPFIERDYQMLAMLSNAISAEMQKNKFLHYTRGLCTRNSSWTSLKAGSKIPV